MEDLKDKIMVWHSMIGVHLALFVCKFTYAPFDRQWERETRGGDRDGDEGRE